VGLARGARFQMRSTHGAAIESSIGERIYTGLFKSSYVGGGGVLESRVSLNPDPAVKPAAQVVRSREQPHVRLRNSFTHTIPGTLPVLVVGL
jgi:hypothetical protein